MQTSDALGAAAAQIGPDAQAAVVLLNKTFGLSHIKIAGVFQAFFGISLTRGASVQIVLRAANRLDPADQEIRQEIRSAPGITPDETGWRLRHRPTPHGRRVGEAHRPGRVRHDGPRWLLVV